MVGGLTGDLESGPFSGWGIGGTDTGTVGGTAGGLGGELSGIDMIGPAINVTLILIWLILSFN